jgi:hypothetical protein
MPIQYNSGDIVKIQNYSEPARTFLLLDLIDPPRQWWNVLENGKTKSYTFPLNQAGIPAGWLKFTIFQVSTNKIIEYK